MKPIQLKHLAIAVLLTVITTPLLADELKQGVNKGQELYTMGNEAYQNKDYVSALKYLFAYRVVNENELTSHEKFLTQLDKAIEISERKINVKETANQAGIILTS